MNIYSVDTLKNILTYHLHIFHVWGTTRGIRLQEAFHLEVSNADFYLLNFYANSWEGSAEDRWFVSPQLNYLIIYLTI